MRRAREDEEPMNREEIRVMAAEQEVWVATAAAAYRMAGIFVTPPPMPTPRPNPPAYQPYAQGGRPPAPTPQPAWQGGVCYNCYQPGHKRAACPYASTSPLEGQPAGGGRVATGEGKGGGGYAQQQTPREPAPLPALSPPPPQPTLQPRSNLPSTQGAKCDNCGNMHHTAAQCRSRPSILTDPP